MIPNRLALGTALTWGLACTALLCTRASAQSMIAVDDGGFTYRLDSQTGTTVLLGSTGQLDTGGVTAGPAGVLYIMADDGATLVTVDPSTGSAVSTLPIGLQYVRAIAFDASTGLIYATLTRHLFLNTDNELWTIDPSTGTTTFIGYTGFFGLSSLAFHPDGTLYAYDVQTLMPGFGLVTIDPATGAGSDPLPGVGMVNRHQFFGISAAGNFLGGHESLYVINSATGSETLIGPTSTDLRGADFEPLPPPGCLGMRFCSPAIPNSTGVPGAICASGSVSLPANDFTLTATNLPPGQFGYFIVSRTQGAIPPPGSAGLLCLTGNIGRYGSPAQIISGPAGSLSIDLTAIPINPPAPVLAGEVWNFQCWYRDSGTSNFTDATSVQF